MFKEFSPINFNGTTLTAAQAVERGLCIPVPVFFIQYNDNYGSVGNRRPKWKTSPGFYQNGGADNLLKHFNKNYARKKKAWHLQIVGDRNRDYGKCVARLSKFIPQTIKRSAA